MLSKKFLHPKVGSIVKANCHFAWT